MPAFLRYIGIDYSGAQTPTASLKGLRIYLAEGDAPPVEVLPPPSPRKYWTRRGIAEWLVDRLAEDRATLVGIDHGFSFPLRYFEVHRLKPDWPAFLDDFQHHWPTDDDHTYVDFVRDCLRGNGAARMGNARWRRLTEERAGGARGAHGQCPLAAADRGARGRSEIGVSIRRAGIGGEIHPCWDSLAALHSPESQRARPFLAVRWLEHSGRVLSGGGGLSVAMEP
jgi:hypothetical protein